MYFSFCFASLLGIPIAVTSSVKGLKVCAITAGIKRYKSIIKKKDKRKNHDKTVLLVQTKLNSIEILISKVLIESYISHDEMFLVNDVLKEYDDMKEETKS